MRPNQSYRLQNTRHGHSKCSSRFTFRSIVSSDRRFYRRSCSRGNFHNLARLDTRLLINWQWIAGSKKYSIRDAGGKLSLLVHECEWTTWAKLFGAYVPRSYFKRKRERRKHAPAKSLTTSDELYLRDEKVTCSRKRSVSSLLEGKHFNDIHPIKNFCLANSLGIFSPLSCIFSLVYVARDFKLCKSTTFFFYSNLIFSTALFCYDTSPWLCQGRE